MIVHVFEILWCFRLTQECLCYLLHVEMEYFEQREGTTVDRLGDTKCWGIQENLSPSKRRV
jgi:hypothetical protein